MKIPFIIVAAALLLAGCGAEDSSSAGADPIASDGALADSRAAVSQAESPADSSETIPVPVADSSESSAPEGKAPRKMKDRITALGADISDYNVTAKVSVTVPGEGTYIREDYEGSITDPDQLAAIWDMLKAVEDTTPQTGLSISASVNSASIRLEPIAGGEPVTVDICIGTANEGEDGGPPLIVLKGRSTVDGDTYSVLSFDVRDGIYSSSWLYDFCEMAVARQENLVSRTRPDSTHAERKSSIVFAERRSNYAWGNYDQISVIDINGHYYSKRLVEDPDKEETYYPRAVEEVIAELDKEIAEGTIEPVGEVDKALLSEIEKKTWFISPDAKREDDGIYAYDMGMDILYTVSDVITEIMGSGDVCWHLADPAAKEICKGYQQLISGAERNEKMP